MVKSKNKFVNSINLNSETDFPYLIINVVNKESHPKNIGFSIMHWHEDLQFVYVKKGKIQLKTLVETITIEKGEAVFINKFVIHHIKSFDDTSYVSYIFPDYFLKFYLGSPAKNLVESITENNEFQFFHFKKDIKWCKKIFKILKQLIILERNKTNLYTYEVLTSFSLLWLTVLKNITISFKANNSKTNLRIQKFLKYIEYHYSEDITLEELSKSANVSKSECLRCFKLSLKTTPYKYVMEFRISKAIEMLQNSNKTISEIAIETGFNQVSYFGKCFKEKTGYSPSEFRKL